MRHKHTLRKIRVNRIFKKVDKEYEEFKKKYFIQPITSAHEEKDNPEAIEDLENLNKHLDEEQADYFKYLDDLFKGDTQS